MNADLRLSVALLTRNRPESLRRCLASLRAQDVQPFETVISDDSDDATAAAALAQEFDARYFAGPRRGLYANRNAAALLCEGTHIRTMDDDHTFPPEHLAVCLDAIARDPQAIWACDETGYHDGELYSERVAAAQLHPAGVGGPVEDPDNCWAIADGATIYPRAVFDAGHRLVEDFGYGSSYLEFGAFLHRQGWRSRLLRSTWIEHRAELATLAQGEPRSQLFASLCFNLHFRPDRLRAARYIVSQAVVRHPSLCLALPALLRRARERWTTPSLS
jgi:glycosyltransferase involved in cell wall biosynthesis